MIPGIETLEHSIVQFLESLFGIVGWFGVIQVADRWFGHWGEATAFFSRLLPVVRTCSLPAGMARMSFAAFGLSSTLEGTWA